MNHPHAPEMLLPCPVCGKPPDAPVDATRLLGVWRIIHRCPVMGFMETSAAELAKATEKWNTRAPSSDYDRLSAECERLRRALGEISRHGSYVCTCPFEDHHEGHGNCALNVATKALAPPSQETQQ